jgi:hypothetical protein
MTIRMAYVSKPGGAAQREMAYGLALNVGYARRRMMKIAV